MENSFVKTTKYFLILHALLFAATLIYIISVRVIRDHFYMYDYRMPWQETYLNSPLQILLLIQTLLYIFKIFLLFPIIALVFFRPMISRRFYIYLIATCFIYLSIKLNLVHTLFDLILPHYDFDGLTFDSKNISYYF